MVKAKGDYSDDKILILYYPITTRSFLRMYAKRDKAYIHQQTISWLLELKRGYNHIYIATASKRVFEYNVDSIANELYIAKKIIKKRNWDTTDRVKQITNFYKDISSVVDLIYFTDIDNDESMQEIVANHSLHKLVLLNFYKYNKINIEKRENVKILNIKNDEVELSDKFEIVKNYLRGR
jgi:hypothetical protein